MFDWLFGKKSIPSPIIKKMVIPRVDSEITQHHLFLQVHGPKEETMVGITQSIMTIGTDAVNLIRLKDPEVAPVHCSLQIVLDVNPWIMLKDMSDKGTLVNGKKIDGEEALFHHDCIRIGQTELKLIAPTLKR